MKITEKQLAITSVASICGLLFIWVVPNTIALRHLLLILGALSAIGLIKANWVYFKKINSSFLPAFCLLGLFAWVLIHYSFFSLNSELELSEIKGVWMRSVIGAIAAVGLGISLTKYADLRKYFYVALFSTPAINVASYIWASYLHGALVKPNDFVRFLFTKIETAYFGAVAASVATGSLIYLLTRGINRTKAYQILWWLLGLILVLASALISSTKNGMAISLGLCLFLALVMAANAILNTGGSKVLSVIVLSATLLFAGVAWEGHKLFAYKGWDTVFQDAGLGLDIDHNQQWQKREGTVPMPINSEGIPAAINTYIRFAYAAVGVRLISEYPMGYGSINRSFSMLTKYAQVPIEHDGQVHSGWIDFGLAFGIPGLILIFSAMLSIVYFGLKGGSSLELPWVIFCLAFLPFGLFAEITWKQYFEATIFFISLGATIVMFAERKPKAHS